MMEPLSRPVALEVLPDNIPIELKALAQWLVWRYQRNEKNKWTKIPICVHNRRHASTTDPETWCSFADALRCYQEHRDIYDGIGFVFTESDPFVGGDIDHCVSPDGTISDDALDILPPTYAELSPSGTGVKFIARSSRRYARKTSKGELYSCKRFFTITGHTL